MEEFRFEVIFLKEAKVFIESQRENVRSKIIYNIWKSRKINDPSLFKKLQNDIWEFRTRYEGNYYRLFAFWDKRNSLNTLVIATHGLMKKTGKIS